MEFLKDPPRQSAGSKRNLDDQTGGNRSKRPRHSADAQFNLQSGQPGGLPTSLPGQLSTFSGMTQSIPSAPASAMNGAHVGQMPHPHHGAQNGHPSYHHMHHHHAMVGQHAPTPGQPTMSGFPQLNLFGNGQQNQVGMPHHGFAQGTMNGAAKTNPVGTVVNGNPTNFDQSLPLPPAPPTFMGGSQTIMHPHGQHTHTSALHFNQQFLQRPGMIHPHGMQQQQQHSYHHHQQQHLQQFYSQQQAHQQHAMNPMFQQITQTAVQTGAAGRPQSTHSMSSSTAGQQQVQQPQLQRISSEAKPQDTESVLSASSRGHPINPGGRGETCNGCLVLQDRVVEMTALLEVQQKRNAALQTSMTNCEKEKKSLQEQAAKRIKSERNGAKKNKGRATPSAKEDSSELEELRANCARYKACFSMLMNQIHIPFDPNEYGQDVEGLCRKAETAIAEALMQRRAVASPVSNSSVLQLPTLQASAHAAHAHQPQPRHYSHPSHPQNGYVHGPQHHALTQFHTNGGPHMTSHMMQSMHGTSVQFSLNHQVQLHGMGMSQDGSGQPTGNAHSSHGDGISVDGVSMLST